MMVNDSEMVCEMKQRSLVNKGDISLENDREVEYHQHRGDGLLLN